MGEPPFLDAEPNGLEPHATKAEHDSLRAVVDAIALEQTRQGETLKFIEQQARLTGQAMELLLSAQGLDMPGDNDA